ncbi:hypothetical protein [Tenacibaculum maritimum]|uniref:Uncharacterized protein n=1 Tax=Tenacibaculum maritimum NCIMB 2154 TaxID=1349785 RepID=A0A2H1EAY1_9FLAO|nr:hypothetical protein [Tenacibaculum maritimum]MCD9562747.1 hypothetical protein [Tenacibaculum maritimum]MCD9565851.1 hypothetical protein [Tenacibaculum maritimum]MCD9579399.1 hypothetical protein [Tenacibaculum maritimum]MCD9596158.1 hypothetical protein [Tenacibaculum maritimum]MCD9611402.1 hypothetical protein [Tenacibaculum maritimum]
MIVTPLDSAILNSKEQYVFYHKMVDFILKELIVRVQQNSLCNHQEITLFKQYTDLLLYSIEAMRIKYMYDEESNMKVDLTDSGFPNYLEFRYLYNDLALRNDYLTKLQDAKNLKEEFLNTLLRKKEPVRKNRLFQAASIIYYSSVNQNYIFNRFVQGKIIEASNKSNGSFLTSWSFYDISKNRPYICFMYFEYKGKSIERRKELLYQVLKESADREMPLDTMAYNIDKKLPDIHPKHIKRIDLGPLHNIFAKDENEITHAILEGIAKKEISLESYALSFKIDEVFSGNTFEEGGFFSKQIMQKWGEVAYQKYIFAPHRIIQMLHNKVPKKLNSLAKPPIQMADIKMK